MALTEVWGDKGNGEWLRVSVSEVDKNYDRSVSADSYQFRCYKCFHYVAFVKGTSYFSSHFKHSRGDEDKDCEDRSVNLGSPYAQYSLIPELPLKLTLSGAQALLYLGMPPATRDELQPLYANDYTLTIANDHCSPMIFKVDPSRFIPNTTNWFGLSLTSQMQLTVAINPKHHIPKLWNAPVPQIPHEGALFDARSGKRICEGGDVQVGKEYYLLRQHGNSLSIRSGDILVQTFPQNYIWDVHKITILRLSKSTSNFCFDELHMRLTQQPSDINILWPPVAQNDDIVGTKDSQLWVYVRGEQDLQIYPASGSYIRSKTQISPAQKVYEIQNSGLLQMICAERYCRTLQCLYVRPPQPPFIKQLDNIRITDGDDCEISETVLSKVPAGRMLRFVSPVDGSITVSDKDGFCYRKVLPADQETRITELCKGLRITVRQGCTFLLEISIAESKVEKAGVDCETQWHGQMIPFPRRFAGMLNVVPDNSPLYFKIAQALKVGSIHEEGYRELQKLMEGYPYD